VRAWWRVSLALSLLDGCRGAEDDRIVADAFARHPLPPKVNREWVERDIRMTAAIRRAVPPRAADAQALAVFGVEKLPRGSENGVAHFRATRSGGYTSCATDVLLVDAHLADLDVRCAGSADSYPAIAATLADVAGAAAVPI
jgi:hypothetical protein